MIIKRRGLLDNLHKPCPETWGSISFAREHVKRLRGVFQKLAAAGLKLKLSKCEFFKKRIIYLGHVVSEKGIEVDPKKTEAVRKWPVPKTVTDVRSFLGFTNQYRKFIPKYTHVAGPLNELVSEH